jgi:hypothetical protein
MTLSITSNGRACCERSRDVELAGRGGRFATTVIERLALIFATNGSLRRDRDQCKESEVITAYAPYCPAAVMLASHRPSSASNWIDTCYVDDPELHPLLTLPTIDRQRACNMHPLSAALQERISEFLAGGPECNRIEERAFA